MKSLRIGDVEIEWLGHASFKIISGGTVIYIDPYILPKKIHPADLILITHEHFDHCSEENVRKLIKPEGIVVATEDCVKLFSGLNAKAIRPNQELGISGIKIETIPAYNINKFRSPGVPFHEKGRKVGYIITVGGKRIYHAGDTDFTPEMKNLKDIDVALVPIGGTYTMTKEEAAEAVNTFKPKVVVPMHYNTFDGIHADAEKFAKLVNPGISVEILE